jgi:hypothetical protein
MNDESYKLLSVIRLLADVELRSFAESKIRGIDEALLLIMEIKHELASMVRQSVA